MNTAIITCDQCETAIEQRDTPKYFITVKQQRMPGKNPALAVHVTGPLDRDYEFCCLKCLAAWAATEL